MRLFCFFTLAALLAAQAPTLEQKGIQARSLMEAGRFAEAAVLWAEMAKAVPGNGGLLLNQGMALHMSGADAQAVPVLESAVKLGAPPPAYLFLGASYLRTNQAAKAIAPLKRFVAADPNHVEARLMLVDAAGLTNQPAEVLPHLEALANLDPQRPLVWYQLGRTYEEMALAEFAQLEKLFPESGPHFALLAESRSKISQNRAAFFFYRQALAKSPRMRGLHSAIADIYRRTGEPSWALSEDAAEVRLGEPACATAKTAECAFAAGNFGQTIALTRSARTAESLYWRVRAYDALARKAFTRLGQLPESAEGYRFQAETHRDANRHAEAAAAWREALRLAPGQPDLTRELIAALLQTKQYDEAQQELTPLLAKSPGADLNSLQGDLFLAQQQPDQAIPYLKRAVAQDPRLLPARAALARALLQTGQPAEALPHATAALPLDTDGSLHFQLARAYQAAGQSEPAAAAMAKYQQILARNREQERVADEQVKITPP
jgi:tetratricopeptide (TPR) repeat protein